MERKCQQARGRDRVRTRVDKKARQIERDCKSETENAHTRAREQESTREV